MFRIYLDVCCLNRPFDDFAQERVALEAEAVLTILNRGLQGQWYLLDSSVIGVEIDRIPDEVRRQKVSAVRWLLHKAITLNDKIEVRALELESLGFKPYDSLHAACAEYGKADVLLTTDDGFIRKAAKIKEFKIRIANPVMWLMEVVQK